MSVEGVEAKVKEVLVDILSVKEEAVVPTARLVEDLQVTSIDQVDILAELENAFGISIQDEDAGNVTTVGEMTELLKQKVAAKEAS